MGAAAAVLALLVGVAAGEWMGWPFLAGPLQNYLIDRLDRRVDIPANDFDKAQNTPLPLGFDKYTGNTFANKDFVLNAIDYLLDDNGVITARNKEITLRPLDKAVLQNDRQYWQSINLIIPIVLLVVAGFLKGYLQLKLAL